MSLRACDIQGIGFCIPCFRLSLLNVWLHYFTYSCKLLCGIILNLIDPRRNKKNTLHKRFLVKYK